MLSFQICREILGHVDKLKNLTGPVYMLDREHHFAEIQKHVEKMQNLQGPKPQNPLNSI